MKDKEEDSYHSGENSSSTTRRGLFTVAAVAALAFIRPKKAFADAVGGDTTILSGMWVWMQKEYAIILPYLETLKSTYEQTKKYVDNFNNFVKSFNEDMQFLQDAYNMLTHPHKNVFYQQYRQIVDYIDNILSQKDNDILSFRLHRFYPVLIEKIDSMANQIDNLSERAKKILDKYQAQGVKIPSGVDPLSVTKEGKSLIRASNDEAKYLESLMKMRGIKDSISQIQEKMPEIAGKNKTQTNSVEFYNALIFPKLLDIMLLQTSVLSEIYQKMNDFFLIMSNQDPIVLAGEKMVTGDEMKALYTLLAEQQSNEKVDSKEKAELKKTKIIGRLI